MKNQRPNSNTYGRRPGHSKNSAPTNSSARYISILYMHTYILHTELRTAKSALLLRWFAGICRGCVLQEYVTRVCPHLSPANCDQNLVVWAHI